MEKSEESTEPVSSSSLGTEKPTAEEIGSPATAGNPAISLLQVSQSVNEPCSPALQFDGSLNESANDCFTPGADNIKPPQLESTRISNNCPGGDFEADNDVSKVQSEPGDSQSVFNAGFVKTKLTPAESSSLNESSSDLVQNSQQSEMENQSELSDVQMDSRALDDTALTSGDSQTESKREEEVEEVKEEVESQEASSLLESSKDTAPLEIQDETAGSDPEVEQLTKLPDTVTELTSKDGVKVYLVGTAHFSLESQEDVAKTILMTRPRVVVVELCVSRLNILRYDEQTILEEAKNLNMEKVRSTIKQYGAVQGALYLLFLSTSAHLTRQLGMAPGGEFRRAYHEARTVPGCRIHLGDRPIHVTLHRALAALSLWQKLKLVWHLLLNRGPISAEEVERCKQKDLLEEMLEEMTGEFPPLSRVFVQERDLCLAHSMQLAANDAAAEARSSQLAEPPAVVGVVGIGHVAGIAKYFEKVTEADVRQVMKVPPRSAGSRIFVIAVKLSALGLLGYGCYKVVPKIIPSRFHIDLSALRPSFLSR